MTSLARRHGNRLSVLNGPLFSDRDRPYRQDFWVPREFWKLILVKDDQGRPRALAFRLSQVDQIAGLPQERFAPDEVGAYEPFQIRVRDLAALTGLDLDGLAGWDPAEAAGDHFESRRGESSARRIANERAIMI